MWPTMNLMLVNLLIAMMNDTVRPFPPWPSSTHSARGRGGGGRACGDLTPSFTQYTEVKEQAKLEWMIEMFHIAKEYRSPSRLNILLLVWDMVTFLYNRAEVETRMKKLIEKPGIGFFGWWDDIRFKFRKFQYGDLPAVDVTETIAETLADMNVVQLQLHQAKESTTCDVERVSDPGSPEIRRASSDDEGFQRTFSIPVTRAASTIMRTASASDTSWVSLRPFTRSQQLSALR